MAINDPGMRQVNEGRKREEKDARRGTSCNQQNLKDAEKAAREVIKKGGKQNGS